MSRPPLPTPLTHGSRQHRTPRRRPPNQSSLEHTHNPPLRPSSPLPTLTTAIQRYHSQTTASKYTLKPGQFDISNPVHVNIRRERSIQDAMFEKDKPWNTIPPSPSHTTTSISKTGGRFIPSSPTGSSFYNLTTTNASSSSLPDINLTLPSPESEERGRATGLRRTMSFQSNLNPSDSILEEEDENEDITATTAIQMTQSLSSPGSNVSSYRGVQTPTTPIDAAIARYTSATCFSPSSTAEIYPSKTVIRAWYNKISGRHAPSTSTNVSSGRFIFGDEDEEDEEFGDMGVLKGDERVVGYISTADRLRQFLERFVIHAPNTTDTTTTAAPSSENEVGKKGGVNTLGYRIFEIDWRIDKIFKKNGVTLLLLPPTGQPQDGKRRTGYILRQDSGSSLIGLTRSGWYRVPFRDEARKWVFGGVLRGVEYLGLDEEVVEGRIRWLGEFWEYDIRRKEGELEEILKVEERREMEVKERAERAERLRKALKGRGVEL
ncbi:hypothetical protein TWF694_004607 [Orbilia ellipsospora]|uniref:Uncharacterized protein n=1 Tax=Orbilia ellipsospora TaxID=2528407 RepID=A0AAV9WVN5_9PEZI